MARGGPMILRLAAVVVVVMLAAAGLSDPAFAQRPVQEGIVRPKPAVVLVVAEVSSELTLDCGAGAGRVKITPAVFRETGTGWFIDESSWLMTNGRVVQPAYEPPRWLANQQGQLAVTS